MARAPARAAVLGGLLWCAGTTAPLCGQEDAPRAAPPGPPQVVCEVGDGLLEALLLDRPLTLDNPAPALNEPESLTFRFTRLNIGSAGSIRFRARVDLRNLRTGLRLGPRELVRVLPAVQGLGQGRVVLRLRGDRLVPLITLTQLDLREVPGRVVETGVRVFFNRHEEELLRALQVPARLDAPWGLPLEPTLCAVTSEEGLLRFHVALGAGVAATGRFPDRPVALLFTRALLDALARAWEEAPDFAEARRWLRAPRVEPADDGRLRIAGECPGLYRFDLALRPELRDGAVLLHDPQVRRFEALRAPHDRDAGLAGDLRALLAELDGRPLAIGPRRWPLPAFAVPGFTGEEGDGGAPDARAPDRGAPAAAPPRLWLVVERPALAVEADGVVLGAALHIEDGAGRVLARLRRAEPP